MHESSVAEEFSPEQTEVKDDDVIVTNDYPDVEDQDGDDIA